MPPRRCEGVATAESKGQDVGIRGMLWATPPPQQHSLPRGNATASHTILTKSQDHDEEGRKGKSRTFLFGCGGNTQSLMQRPHVTRVYVLCVCGVCVWCVCGVCVCVGCVCGVYVCVCVVCVCFVKLHSINFSFLERERDGCVGRKGLN